MRQKKKVLFVPESVSLAHVGRCLSLANTLDKNQYEIIFAAGQSYRDFILADGYEVKDLPVQDSNTLKEKWYTGKAVFSADIVRLYVDAEIDLLSKLKPDLVIGDFRITLGISARVVLIPYISVLDVRWSPMSTQKFVVAETFFKKTFGYSITSTITQSPFFSFFLAGQIVAYQKECRRFKRSVPRTLKEMYSDADFVLYPNLPELEPVATLLDNHRYLGPVIWEPKLELPKILENLPNNKKIIYISPGTSGLFGKDLIRAIKQQGYFLIIASAGQQLDIAPDDNTIIVDFISASKILDKVSVMITHGGCAPGYQALSCGVPILGFPYNMDQYLFMEAVTKNRAGLFLRSEQRNFSNIKKALDQLLENPMYRQSALHIKDQVKKYNVAKNFNDFLSGII